MNLNLNITSITKLCHSVQNLSEYLTSLRTKMLSFTLVRSSVSSFKLDMGMSEEGPMVIITASPGFKKILSPTTAYLEAFSLMDAKHIGCTYRLRYGKCIVSRTYVTPNNVIVHLVTNDVPRAEIPSDCFKPGEKAPVPIEEGGEAHEPLDEADGDSPSHPEDQEDR